MQQNNQFQINASPQEVLDTATEFMSAHRLFRGARYRLTGNHLKVDVPDKPKMIDSGAGLVALLGLSIVTGGVFLACYIPYALIFRNPPTWIVSLTLEPASRGNTILSIWASDDGRKQEEALLIWAEGLKQQQNVMLV